MKNVFKFALYDFYKNLKTALKAQHRSGILIYVRFFLNANNFHWTPIECKTNLDFHKIPFTWLYSHSSLYDFQRQNSRIWMHMSYSKLVLNSCMHKFSIWNFNTNSFMAFISVETFEVDFLCELIIFFILLRS